MLGLAILFEGGSWWVALKDFRRVKGTRSWFQAIRESKDPTTFTVLFEDSAALVGLAIALVGTAASQWLEEPVLDGVASVAIGFVLAITAILLARETKGLLIGESARPELRRGIERIAMAHPGVDRAVTQMTVHMAPDQVVGIVNVDFADRISSQEVEAAAATIEQRIRETYPEMVAIFVRPRGGHLLAAQLPEREGVPQPRTEEADKTHEKMPPG